jgi:autotransporter-associated beta strand protein
MEIRCRKNSFLPLTAALALVVNQATAGTTWDGGAAVGNWQSANNWDSNVLPTLGATTDLLFRQAASGITASYIQASSTVRSLTFNSNTSAVNFIVGLTNGNANAAVNLTMGDATNAAAITLDSGAGNIRIGTNTNATAGSIILANNLTVAQNSTTGTLTIDRPITESGGARTLTKTGAGMLLLSGANTYTGTTTIQNGTLALDGAANRLAVAGAVVLGDTGTTGKLVLGGTTTASQTLTALTTTGLGGSVEEIPQTQRSR